MGYEITATSGQELWRRCRPQFPVTEHLVYLNHAAVAPLPLPVTEALRRFTDDACHFGSYHYDNWLDTYERLRVACARLLGADRSEIAIVKNTSEGIATVALGIDWRPGDKVVAFREEFPANYFPWLRLEAKGVQLEWLSITDPPEKIDAAATGARLLAVSFVNYLSGHRMDLEAVGEICHRRGCFFFVDAIQGLGALPIDVRRARIHALAADGHKWLLGPEGCGILYIQRDMQDSIEPVEFGWTNVAHYADYASRDMTLRPDAGRYECGTLNTIGCFGLCAAVEYLLEIGIEEVGGAVLSLAERIARGAAAKGYEILGGRSATTTSGIVSFRKEDVNSRVLVRSLRDQGIIAAPRQGWVRASPHFYISPDEADRLVEALP
jgi:cysteine desulfurase/selenocysteine lyase